ncbi:MAG TPA: IPT/TIG domain-containing protein, partial [Polyangia bacterium]
MAGAPGVEVTITGSDFTSADEVSFGSSDATFTILDDGEITAVVPDGATSGPIIIYTADGVATSTHSFTVSTAPVIATLTPATARVGDVIIIDGNGFSDQMELFFAAATDGGTIGPPDFGVDGGADFGDGGIQGVVAPFSCLSDSEVSVIVPADAVSGPITIYAAGGESQSPMPFTLDTDPVALPTVVAFMPTSGSPGTSVVVSGSDFEAGVSEVSIGGTDAQFAVDADDQISLVVPVG